MTNITSNHTQMPLYRPATPPAQLLVETRGTTTALPLDKYRAQPHSDAVQGMPEVFLAFVASALPTPQSTTDVEADATTAILVSDGMEMLQTEEELEQFQDAVVEFLSQFGRDGITAMRRRLLHSNDPDMEPFARRFLRALGQQRTAAFNVAATNLLVGQINSPSGGRRSAAAAALGAFPSSTIMVVLEERSAVETNRFVKAGIDANLRVFKANGISASKAV
jgi:hypothetical protein